MIRILIVCFLIFSAELKAQIIYGPIQADPNRYEYSSKVNARIAADYSDTLDLPFFDDFTSPNPSIDSIYFINDQIRVTTLGHHGLKSGDFIYITMQEPEAAYLSKSYFVKADSKSSFILYNNVALDELARPQTIPQLRWHGYWRRPSAKIGPNPDSIRWVQGGGSYINNTFAINPPSNYVASFDGLDQQGNPYTYNDINGPIDHLTSLPINLSGLIDSNVVLSFYWQIGGNGFFPDPKDSLYLSFKDKNGNWSRRWGKKGGGFAYDSASFYYAEVPVNDSSFFHAAFQFRFQAVGNRGGSNDNWNIDYVYLDKNWNNEKRDPRDRTISRSQSSILKKYQSIPIDHFLMAPESHLADSVRFELRSLSNAAAFLDFRNNYVKEGNTKHPFQVDITTALIEPKDTIPYSWRVNKEDFEFNSSPLQLTYIVEAFASDPDKLNGIDFTTNNIDSGSVSLRNYYAYDDGTAEQTGGAPLGGTMIFEFTNFQPGDTLTHIDLYTPVTATSRNDFRKSIKLRVFDKDKKAIGGEFSRAVEYPGRWNGFNSFIVDSIRGGFVINSDIFYIGFVVPSSSSGVSNYLPIGVDVNTKTDQKIFYRELAYQPWKELKGLGTFMIRPVFDYTPITGVMDRIQNNLLCTVYPVPTTGKVWIEGNVDNFKVYDFTGNILMENSFSRDNTTHELNIAVLSNGMYYLHLSNHEGLNAVKKITVVK